MKFKRIICILLILCMIIPLQSFAYSSSVIPNDPITMPKATPVIDGDIETTGVWSYVARMDEATCSDFWSGKGISMSAQIYFAYNTSGIYFAADITDDDFTPSAGYDNINNNGNSYPYGFNGDVFTFMFDPLGSFEKSSYQTTAHYNVGIYANGTTYIYRSMATEGNITTLTNSAGKITENGWKFEAYIPWSIIYKDAKTLYPTISISQNLIYTQGLTSYASCMYLDRKPSSPKNTTISRVITVRDFTYDKVNGCETNGISAKAYGLTLINGTAPAHSWNDWVITKAATCTTNGSQRRTCQTCNEVETQVIPATGHTFGDWVIVKAATTTTAGSKTRTCTVCKTTETYEIPALGENDPIVVAYYNASQVTVDEFTDIDVLNFHPAFIAYTATSGKDDVITDDYSLRLNDLKTRAYAQNPNIKINFTLMVQNLSVFESWFASKSAADTLATKIVQIIADYGFDGFDIDYEYPSSGNYRSATFVYFMAQMRYKLDQLSKTTKKDYLLSMAVPGGTWAFTLFDMQSLADYVNYFNIMDYDMNINATYAHHHTSGAQVASDIATYLYYGIAKEKIVVGCGMYSLKWNNVSAGTTHGLNQTGTRDSSNIHYSQLLDEYVNKNGFVRYWDDTNKAPYLYNASSKVFISYDDSESVRYKCECVTKNDIGGIMFFDYCTCDGEGLFANVSDWLSGGSSHTHNFVYTSTVNPTCTTDGYFLYTCSCSQTKKEPIAALGHSFGDWVITKQPTTTEPGTKTKTCTRCNAKETEDVPVLTPTIEVTNENYNIIISNAVSANAIRLVKGHYTTISEIKNASGVISYTTSIPSLTNEYGQIIIPCLSEGEHTLWIRTSTEEKIFYTTLDNFTPEISASGIKVTVNNLSSAVSSVLIANGNYTTYRGVKDNMIYSATSAKYIEKHSLTYTLSSSDISDSGVQDVSVCLRNSDGTNTILHAQIKIDVPTIVTDGLNLNLSNIGNLKCIRRVYGTYSTLAEVKAAENNVVYTSSIVKSDNTTVLHIPLPGEVTLAIQYKNGYTKIVNYTMVKKVPDFDFSGNTVKIGNLDGFYVVRYAKGTYYTSNAVKNAAGSVILRDSAIGADGKITVSNLAPGNYTFVVQYKEESTSVYNITVK